MGRQFSLSYLTTATSAPPEMIYQAARSGFDFVSLRTVAMGLPGEADFGLAKNKSLLKNTIKALEDTGIKILDVENTRIHDDVDINSYLPEMEMAAALGAQAVLTNVWSAERSFNIDVFAHLCAQAKSFGLWVNLEFVTWSTIKNIREALDLIDASGADNAGIIVDTLHFDRSYCSLDDLKKIAPERLKVMHLCDVPAEQPRHVEEMIHTGRAERLYVGEGGIDIAAIIRNMPSDIIYGLEIPHVTRSQVIGSAEHVHRCIETARAYFEIHAL